ncbi:hypothetical protein [Rubinisphaera margarita]|uniref:hypothetical protein n=1 Tax=Rubinisphaera margarita TaxID=2909586 RepID=UPI001EE91AD0|nr:hypothetical protein [Rubinisphaera margarita]MCG6155549.1 hypothetical protein [Rubinisphaera margarita]
MSCVSIYRPSGIAEEPMTIPFPRLRFGRTSSDDGAQTLALNRARLMHHNRFCPCCNSVAVEPLELNDPSLNASGMPIPGTATVVAFHCNGCYHEWPVAAR